MSSSRQWEGLMHTTHDLEAAVNAKSWFGLVTEPSYDTYFSPVPVGSQSYMQIDSVTKAAQTFILPENRTERGIRLRVCADEEFANGQLVVQIKTSFDGPVLRSSTIDLADLPATLYALIHTGIDGYTYLEFESPYTFSAGVEYYIICTLQGWISDWDAAYWISSTVYPLPGYEGKGYQWNEMFGWVELASEDYFFAFGSVYHPPYGILEEQT